MSAPIVSVVVPTVDRVELLRRCLDGLAKQDIAEPFEVIVVHDGHEAIEELVAGYDSLGLRGLRIAASGVSSKRNAGWQAATADLVAFTDDDCEPTPAWLSALVDAAAGGAALVAGPVHPHPADADVSGVWARTVSQPADAGFYPGCNLLFRRDALEHAEGFDRRLRAGEDTDLAWRVIDAGGDAAWADEGVVWHAVRTVTLGQHFRSLPRWEGLALVVRRHPHLRARLAYKRWFWKDSHPAACLALAGLLLAPFDRRALLAVAPVVARRVRAHGARDGVALAASDVAEAAVVIAGSVRHGSVVL